MDPRAIAIECLAAVLWNCEREVHRSHVEGGCKSIGPAGHWDRGYDALSNDERQAMRANAAAALVFVEGAVQVRLSPKRGGA